ncbi:DNA-3-methyladenine glycosylase family protein [Rhizobium sp. TRM95796]|uniref:DNA-3-methyladenine glycosylase family protein n=1 Tax=Rhizobium sp. TRM95796 TaxID=2979862 RepID=UPI0021E92CB4|nr:DNA-3-methyladenine glycosylase 2 family protein [Rhizobium sp. TRM95796]MCV3767391.1 DNA-3-methyladenine glycosylase 2 family protein [Rhizobium sp. TRM95796]
MRLLTSETEITEAVADLVALDPRFAPVAARAGAIPLRFRPAGYAALASVIVSQMVSRASAEAIWARLETACGVVEPERLSSLAEADLRAVGLSGAKIVALRAVAEACGAGLDLKAIAGLPADEAIGALTAIRGVGPWTAEVYLLFSGGHADIFPAGDVALQTAAARAFGLTETPQHRQLRRMAEDWRPLRSAAARLLWAFYATERRGAGMPAG